MESEARLFWLDAAESYVSDCARRASVVRASELAQRLELTPVQLAREFHVAVGVGVKAYLARRQLEIARELLRSTRRSTADIARAAGFGTVRSFYRAFKQLTGESPTAFRKKCHLSTPPPELNY